MRFSFTAALYALSLGFAAADFQIYTDASITGQLDGNYNSISGFFLLPGPPSCNDICHHAIFLPRVDDASAGRSGMRCKGCGSGPIKQMEFHNPDKHIHWTIYRGRGFKMISAKDGSVQGHCTINHNDRFTDCSCGLGNSENGHRLFNCKSHFTAKQLGYFK